MTIYVFFFSFLIIGSLIVRDKRNHLFFLATLLIMGLVIGLRDASVGSDTGGYIEDFKLFSGMSFGQMWEVAIAFKEPLFVIVSWFFSLLSKSYTFFLLGWAMFPTIALYIGLKDELKSGYDYIFTFLVVFILGLFAFFVAGIRQTAAISVVFLSYRFIQEKRLIPFLICMGVAYLFHHSSLVFIIAYPMRFLKVKWQYLVALVVVLVLFLLNRFGLVLVVSQFFFDDLYSNYLYSYERTQSLSAFYVQVILLLFCFIKRKTLSAKDESNNMLFTLAITGLFFQALAGQLAEMSRLSFYYCISLVILFPKAMREYDNWVKIFFIVVCLFYLFFLTSANLPTYRMAPVFQ